MTHWVICGSTKEAQALAQRGPSHEVTFVGGPAYIAGHKPPPGTLVTFTADFMRGMPALSPYYLTMLGGAINDAGREVHGDVAPSEAGEAGGGQGDTGADDGVADAVDEW